jgi:hypothetical protein
VKLVPFTPALGVAVLVCACAAPPSPTAPSLTVSTDRAISAPDFEPGFFRAFLQNAFESPDRLEPIRTLNGPIRIYLRSQDDDGRSIDSSILQSTERILGESVVIWSGERFGVTEVARGIGTREKIPGWITIKWRRPGESHRCGRSTVGVDGGYIEFNLSPSCSCGAAAGPYARLVRHELGHAMGYYHTDSVTDVMYGQPIPAEACDLLPSDRERAHARLAYGASR